MCFLRGGGGGGGGETGFLPSEDNQQPKTKTQKTKQKT